MFILFQVIPLQNERLDRSQYPPPSQTTQPPISFSNIKYVLNVEGNKMQVREDIPIEARVSYQKGLEEQRELIRERSERAKEEMEEKEEIKEKEEREKATEEEEREKENVKEVSLDELAEEWLESCEEWEVVLNESEDMIETLETKVETRKGVQYLVTHFLTKYVGKVADAEEKARSLKEEIMESEEIEEKGEINENIAKKIEEFEEAMDKIDAKVETIDDALENIKEDSNRIMHEGSRIAALSELEDLLKKDAELIKDKALEDSIDERNERIEKAKMLIEELTNIIEKMKTK